MHSQRITSAFWQHEANGIYRDSKAAGGPQAATANQSIKPTAAIACSTLAKQLLHAQLLQLRTAMSLLAAFPKLRYSCCSYSGPV